MNTRFHSHRFHRLFFSIVILSFLFSCSINKKVEINQPIIVKGIEKIPLRAGIYLNQEFRNFVKTNRIGDVVIYMGESLSKGAEEIVDKAFREVVILHTKDLGLMPKEVQVLILPEIEKIYGGVQGEIVAGWKDIVLVRIKWTIMDRNGKILYMNTFASEAEYKRKQFTSGSTRVTWICEAYAKAIENNLQEAFVSITSTRWWHSIKE